MTMLTVPIRRLCNIDQGYDQAVRILSIMRTVVAEGISEKVMTFNFPFRYCMDLSNEEGRYDCNECPLGQQMMLSSHGTQHKPCICNIFESLFRESGMEIDDSMAYMRIMNDSRRKFNATLLWLHWIAHKVMAIYSSLCNQKDMRIEFGWVRNRFPHAVGMLNSVEEEWKKKLK
jgi:hypothetical protein